MYSQNLEEKVILECFNGYKGTLIDLGCNDGITLSNSRALIEKGWYGLLVEASPQAVSRLRDNYFHEEHNNIQIIFGAVGSYDGEITLHQSGEHLGKGDVALVSTIIPSERERWVTEVFEEVKVPCYTFDSILKKSKLKKFDFISIDIEGMELEVLPQMDFEKMGTKLVCVEYNGKNEERFTEIMKGFNLIHRNGENLIYAR